MDGVEIGRRLRQMPVEASVAFAVRTGLRMLLWVAQSKEKQVLMRWEEKDRVRHLLAVFLAFDQWQTTNGFQLLVSIRGGPSVGRRCIRVDGSIVGAAYAGRLHEAYHPQRVT
jgi:hypothetical protein